MKYPDASVMRYPDASKPWDPRAKQAGPALTRRVPQITGAAAASSGNLPPPANAAAAAGNSPLNVPQAAMVVGEPIPVIWGRRRGTVGGVLIFPKATEARFENSSTTVTSRYHMVLADGRLPDIQRRDVRLGECRIGDFSQFYNARAGSWTPGNFATAQTGYSWTPTNYTGGGGNYQGLSTFEAGATFAGGSDDWRTSWNIFLRGGTIVERGRLLDSTVDSSDNIADLVLWALQRSGRVPDGMIDLTSLTASATFTEAVGLWCNGEFGASANLGDWLIRILPDFLLRETKVGGKFGLRPLLPVNANGTINTGAIEPEWVLTEAAIVPDSYQIEYSDAASRRPVAMAMIWRQQHDDTDVPIVRTLAVGDPNASGPVEQHDLSQYATTENHAAKVGTYLYARRTLSTHTATVRLKPGNQTGTIAEGDVVMVYLQVETSREPASVINRFYVVESISHALTGEETLQLSHFPVNSEGQSLIALAVANATAPGAILTSNRTGGSCDLAGASSSTTVPAKTTSGTPINPQGTGGGSSITYWAATGAFISLFSGAGAPSDSPPGPASGGAKKFANTGGPTAPSTGINALGGDPVCPYGYEPFDPDAFAYFRCVPNVLGQNPWQPTASTSFVAFSSILAPRVVEWPGKNRFCVIPPTTGAGGDLVIYGYVDKSIPLSNIDSSDVTGNYDIGATGDTGCFIGRELTYEFSNSNSANATVLARWSGNSNVDTIADTGYICNTADGSPGTPSLSRLYTVVEGDSMASISQKMYGTTARANDIKNANTWLMGLDNWGLVPGMVLVIPA
jgi:hypothetical protein